MMSYKSVMKFMKANRHSEYKFHCVLQVVIHIVKMEKLINWQNCETKSMSMSCKLGLNGILDTLSQSSWTRFSTLTKKYCFYLWFPLGLPFEVTN